MTAHANRRRVQAAEPGPAPEPPEPGTVWMNWKTGPVLVLEPDRDSDTGKPMDRVRYQHISSDDVIASSGPVYSRPLAEWHEQIERKHFAGPRFTFVGEALKGDAVPPPSPEAIRQEARREAFEEAARIAERHSRCWLDGQPDDVSAHNGNVIMVARELRQAAGGGEKTA